MPGPGGPGWESQANHYAQLIGQKYGRRARSAYLKMVSDNPNIDPRTVARSFILNIGIKGLDQAIQDALVGTQSAFAQGAASGFGTAGLGGGGASDDWKNLFTRLAEFGIGAVLIIVGLNAILSRTKVYQNTEKVVAGVATRGAIK